MASDLENKAKEAFIDDHFELAVDLYTQAIALSPNNAELYIDRAQAHIKLNLLTEAVADAKRAIELDPSSARAYLRKGTACLKLEEYQTAKEALEAGAALNPGDSKFTNLIRECEKLIAEETGALSSKKTEETPVDTKPVVDTEPEYNTSKQLPEVPPPKPKYRHELYQKPEEVVVTIFAKGVPASSVAIDFGEQILSVSIDIPGEDAYHFQPRLFAKIVPDKCKFSILSTKIEIRLAKAEPIHWTSLEYKEDTAVVQRAVVSSDAGAQRPVYPSSKPKRVDWDKIEAQVKKEEKDEKLDGDAALNKFFREIYSDADEDTRRAMQKSFVESNGTVLSTNWKEVGNKMVQGSPPDGMEMKKWEM